ncbi:MAG: L-aspartate oxidase [Verrucomicrobiota bacterium]|nr:L-aspartate oxidase [Verrucomicrobiota bacterium]MEE2813663.1 L-aspartate oxidase [Verrucomicrobiota bacterium]
MKQFDYIVVGSGIAGLTFALKVARHGRVAIVTKKNLSEANTQYAQGGIAAVTKPTDSIELHVADTLRAGAGLCREEVVQTVVEEGPDRVQELIDLGMDFTREETISTDGERFYSLGKEGGHSKRRVLHTKDATGREIMRALLAALERAPNVSVFEDHFAIDLITTAKLGCGKENRCVGAYVLNRNTGKVETFSAPHVVLATGGSGKVYLYTTNPDIATGDGVAMAYRAGVAIANMEFTQFHPTCLYHPQAKSYLVSEALRGEGAVLKDLTGNEFMAAAHPLAALAPRDIVARTIDSEMKRSGAGHMHLDITHKSAPFIMGRFPNIYRKCLEFGIDITKQAIPVVPAAHYQCGGVKTDVDGCTELPGLYAVGEVASTGLHGANRLASNSLLEGLVCAHRAAQCVINEPQPDIEVSMPLWQSGQAEDPDELVVVSHNWDEVRRCMWDYVSIVRTRKRLLRGQSRIENLREEIRQYYWDFKVTADLLELRNIAQVAEIIIACGLQRPESRGLHYNLDCPGLDETWAHRDTIMQREPGPGVPAGNA